MKKLLVFIPFVLFLVVAGCGDKKYDNLIVKDAQGNLYKLKHNLGDTYFIEKIDYKAIAEFK